MPVIEKHRTSSASSESKSEGVAKACIFKIATGVWLPGQRLPSTREGAMQWQVSPLTVLHAYQQLVEMGLVRSEERSGFYVETGDVLLGLTKNGMQLEGLYDEIVSLIRKHTELLPAGALQFLAQMALERARKAPENAFVECTAYQSKDLARQVEEKLNQPCLALTTDQLASNGHSIPGCVRTLMTTVFHYEEVAAVAKSLDLRLCTVPIEQDPTFAATIAQQGHDVLLLSLDDKQAELVADAISVLHDGNLLSFKTDSSTPQTIENRLEDWLGKPEFPNEHHIAVLSTTLWSSISEQWKACKCVMPYAYRISESAWPAIMGDIGLPLGLT